MFKTVLGTSKENYQGWCPNSGVDLSLIKPQDIHAVVAILAGDGSLPYQAHGLACYDSDGKIYFFRGSNDTNGHILFRVNNETYSMSSQCVSPSGISRRHLNIRIINKDANTTSLQIWRDINYANSIKNLYNNTGYAYLLYPHITYKSPSMSTARTISVVGWGSNTSITTSGWVDVVTVSTGRTGSWYVKWEYTSLMRYGMGISSIEEYYPQNYPGATISHTSTASGAISTNSSLDASVRVVPNGYIY